MTGAFEAALLSHSDRARVVAADETSDTVHAQPSWVLGECEVDHPLRRFAAEPLTAQTRIDPPVRLASPLETALDLDQVEHPEEPAGVLAMLKERGPSPCDTLDVLHTGLDHRALKEVRIALALVIHRDPSAHLLARMIQRLDERSLIAWREQAVDEPLGRVVWFGEHLDDPAIDHPLARDHAGWLRDSLRGSCG